MLATSSAIVIDRTPTVGHPRNRQIEMFKTFRKELTEMEDAVADEGYVDLAAKLADALAKVDHELKALLLERELDVEDER